ncbi:MAG: hypothetical protein NT145_08700 [Elusimicrobia bacterium]|nr:hypothetical protein [Elusimicrobiota bacterium]
MQKRFFASIDDKKSRIYYEKKKEYPAWTKLKFHRCSNCTLSSSFCPAACVISEPALAFSDSASCKPVLFTIHINGKSTDYKTTLEEGLSTLYQYFLWPSNCPIFGNMNFLLSNILPGKTVNEFASSAIKSYIRHNPTIDLSKIKANFFNLFLQARAANKYFLKRLSEFSNGDANRNALSLIDNYCLKIINLEKKGMLDKYFEKV